MSAIDYKKKYKDLRARYMHSLDLAFRTGYEQGYREAQIESASQQSQMMQQQMGQQQAMMEQQGAEQGQEQLQAPQEQMGQTSELDQAISQLEELVNKSEITPQDLKKTLDLIKSESQHKKMLQKTKSIDITPRQLSQSYKVNLSDSSKTALSMQEKILADIMNKWEQETLNSSKDITTVLGTEALTKKEEK